MKRRDIEKYNIEKYFSTFVLVGGIYPVPKWFLKKSAIIRYAWKAFFYVADICILYSITNIVTMHHPKDKVHLTLAAGTLGNFTIFKLKNYVFYTRVDVFTKTVNELCDIGKSLDTNPIKNLNYLQSQEKYLKPLLRYCNFRMLFVMAAQTSITIFRLIQGAIVEPSQRQVQMDIWYPFSFDNYGVFVFACLIQVMSYTIIANQDGCLDSMILSVLGIYHHNICHMRALLHELINDKDNSHKRMKIQWWIRQHLHLIRTLRHFEIIIKPWLCFCFSQTTIYFFAVMWRLTEGDEPDWGQQGAIIQLGILNLIQLFMISNVGEKITQDSYKISHALMTKDLWDYGKPFHRILLNILTFCTHPFEIVFADGRVFNVEAFVNIFSKISGYFVTIYQLRQ